MASLRPSKCYHWDKPAYTRVSKNPADSYITGVPAAKITKFDLGNKKDPFPYEIGLVSLEQIQIRHNALEACRQTMMRYLEKNLGRQNFRFKILVYPHHIMRENKMATGAGADRVQEGMRKSFGKPIGKTARVKKKQTILWVRLNKEKPAVAIAKEALRRGAAKLPARTTLVERELETPKASQRVVAEKANSP